MKGFIDGLDEMSMGRLCFEILDPIELSRYLRTIDKGIRSSDYELAFLHTYQYYAEPMVSFANSSDYLIDYSNTNFSQVQISASNVIVFHRCCSGTI